MNRNDEVKNGLTRCKDLVDVAGEVNMSETSFYTFNYSIFSIFSNIKDFD
jgi:hypothetical protein